MSARLDKIEAKAQRITAYNNNHPNGENDNSESKAFASFIRTGDASEMKALASDNDPQSR